MRIYFFYCDNVLQIKYKDICLFYIINDNQWQKYIFLVLVKMWCNITQILRLNIEQLFFYK